MSPHRFTLLLIEDNPADRVQIERLLSSAAAIRFDVTHAETLAAGCRLLAEKTFSGALLDLHLPDSRGMATYLTLNAAAPRLPIVILSGLDDEQLALQAVHDGAQDYLVKGRIDGEALARSLRYASERKQTEIALHCARQELEERVEARTAELKRAQEQARRQQEELAHAGRLNLMGGMAAGMAHELTQPLTSIVAFADTCLSQLKRRSPDSTVLEGMLREVSAEAVRASEIIKRLRRLVGKRPPRTERIDLNGLTRETLSFLGRELHVRQIEVEWKPDELLPEAECDRIQIQQVLINLIQNAWQAMDGAAVAMRRLEVATLFDETARMVEVRIRDRGPPVEAATLENMFAPFYTTRPAGLGLGLSISRSIVEKHGGRLTAQPCSDGGLTACFTIPIEAPEYVADRKDN